MEDVPPVPSPAADPGLSRKPSRAELRAAADAALRHQRSASTVKSSLGPPPAPSAGSAGVASPSASIMRSTTSNSDFMADAEALLRAKVMGSDPVFPESSTVSSSSPRWPATTTRSSHAPPPVALPSRPLSSASASVSRSRSARADVGASADELLRASISGSSRPPLPAVSAASVPRSPSSGSPLSVPTAKAPSASVTRSRHSRGDTGLSADEMLRASVSGKKLAGVSSESVKRGPSSGSPSFSGSFPAASHTRHIVGPPHIVDSLKLARSSGRWKPTLPDHRASSALAHPAYAAEPPPYTVTRLSSTEKKARMLKMQKDSDSVRSRTPARSTAGMYKSACSVDLLFLIDATYSMHSYITSVKEQVNNIIEDAKKAFLNEAEVYIAIIVYRDHCSATNIEFLDFTANVESATSFLGSIAASGGGDIPEDVLGGIRKAINASWKHQTRCIVHIADAPAHGRDLHELDDEDDYYPTPGSEPHHLTYEPLLKQLIALNVNYAFLRIHSITDRMNFMFSQVYKEARAEARLHKKNAYQKRMGASDGSDSRIIANGNASAILQFEELELGATYHELRHLVVGTITRSVTRTAGRLTMALARDGPSFKSPSLLNPVTEEEEGAAETDGMLEKVPPQWDTPGWLDWELKADGWCPDMSMHTLDTLDNMMELDSNIKPGFVQLHILARSKPFSQGAMRTAAYARTAHSSGHFVIKEFKTPGSDMAALYEDMRAQALCKAFALEFNALLDPRYSLDFVVTAALEYNHRDGSRQCVSLEPYIPGEYIKYNNNSIYVNPDVPADDPQNMVAQAFSHFTFERSWGRFLVNDIQGVGNLMTDPSIQSKDPERFKLSDTNLAEEGFKFFFTAHNCNALCARLELKTCASMLVEGGVLEFRRDWPAIDCTVYCSNKFCRRILRTGVDARKSDRFPGYNWCPSCFPQLDATTSQLVCAEMGEPEHLYDVSWFFYESQGEAHPDKCSDHQDVDMADSKLGAVGGDLFARMKGSGGMSRTF